MYLRKIIFLSTAFLTALGILPLASEEKYFPVEKLQPGMRGITYTVLQGKKIEPIETEILGVAKNFLGPGYDLIIAKLIDPKTILTGAVHGMSGSPLYIEGKMVGALSRRIAIFEKDGHCGFTPIKDMLTVDARVKQQSYQAASTTLPAGWTQASVETLSVPWTVSGASVTVVQQLAEKLGFQKTDWNFVVGGAAGQKALKTTNPKAGDLLQPGAPVAAVLMSGDIEIAGTGTLTWRSGQRILGFGHPMMGFGVTEWPMATAEIITTIPSYYRPYKLANIGEIVGTISQDRLSAIGGIVGQVPQMARYEIVREHEGIPRPILKGELTTHSRMVPLLLGVALSSALMDTDDYGRIMSGEIQGYVQWKGLPPLQINQVFSGEDFDLVLALLRFLNPIRNLYSQKQEKLEIEQLKLKVSTYEKQNVWKVHRLLAPRTSWEPHSKIPIKIELMERYGMSKNVNMEVPLPENLKSGVVKIRIVSGEQRNQEQLLRNHGTEKTTDLIQRLNRRFLDHRLYIQLLTEQAGQIVSGRELPVLPHSVREIMEGGVDSLLKQPLSEKIWWEQSIALEGVAHGNEEIILTIAP